MTTLAKRKYEAQKSHQIYKLKNGKRVPGASTIAKIGDSAEPLIAWAWNLGCQNIDYRKVRDAAADSGTAAHFMIECYMQQVEPDLSDLPKPIVDRAETAFLHFLSFWQGEKLTAAHQELQLVSETHGYGGTLDMVAQDEEGRFVLLDFKSGNRIYQSAFCQLAGYEMLWNENRPLPIHRRIIVRIPKDDQGQFEIRTVSAIEPYWMVFKAQLALYVAMKSIKDQE